ncbi:MAG: hypothetical protein OXU45_03110, partial [Candidatus Melainabacteria bacterium]|nr:hypothetical protein [Candidatus Melainabacteria bacterium]
MYYNLSGMPHKTKFLYLLSLLLFITPVAAVETISTADHKIRKLRLSTDPTRPRVGDAVEVSATFNLKSPTGFDFDRLRAYFNRVNGTALVGTFELDPEQDVVIDEDTEQIPVKFSTTQSRTLNKNQTEVIFQYLLTSTKVEDDPPLAQKSKIIVARGSANSGGGGGGNGGGNGGGGGGDANGDPSIVRKALYLEVFEDSTTDISSVSIDPKELVLRVTHDPDLISKVNNGALFLQKLDPVISNLKIKRRVQNEKDKFVAVTNGNIQKSFSWTVENPSGNSSDPELTNYLVTDYHSNGTNDRSRYFEEIQNLVFSVDLKEHFEEDIDLEVDNDIVLNDSFRYKLNPIGLSLFNAELSTTDIDFNQNTSNAPKKKQLLESSEFTLTAEIDASSSSVNGLLSNAVFDSTDFKKSSKISFSETIKVKGEGKKTITQSQRISADVSNNGGIAIS